VTIGYISIGSNIDKEFHIPASLKRLRQLFGKLLCSSIYENEAVGFVGDKFHNLVVQFESDLSAKAVAKLLRQVELDHGRSPQAEKFSSRSLDLDLILYGDQVIDDGQLRLPRDEICLYAFVLEPLAEIAANQLHPTMQIGFGELWQNFDKQDLQQSKVSPNWLSDE
jgi:2-amino-4-hydroxy-6-hydroxymethyldihydropteridine diphosphokinase